MKRISFFILLGIGFGSGLFGEDFISKFEYGQMLYNNPRGVSCVSCHGPTGEGMDIITYVEDNGTKTTLSGPDIRSATLEQISQSIKEGKGVMPRYFLTDKEIRTIYAYLKKVNSDNNESDHDE